MSDTKQKAKEGKVLGKIAFFISEILVVLLAIAIIISSIVSEVIDTNMISQLLMFQGTIFVTVWGAKASSNFAKKRENNDEAK